GWGRRGRRRRGGPGRQGRGGGAPERTGGRGAPPLTDRGAAPPDTTRRRRSSPHPVGRRCRAAVPSPRSGRFGAAPPRRCPTGEHAGEVLDVPTFDHPSVGPAPNVGCFEVERPVVRGTPRNGPMATPCSLDRTATQSPLAIMSSLVRRRSAMIELKPPKTILSDSRPRTCPGLRGCSITSSETVWSRI